MFRCAKCTLPTSHAKGHECPSCIAYLACSTVRAIEAVTRFRIRVVLGSGLATLDEVARAARLPERARGLP